MQIMYKGIMILFVILQQQGKQRSGGLSLGRQFLWAGTGGRHGAREWW